MSITQLITWITIGRAARVAETVSYEAIFKGSCTTPRQAAGDLLPGLRRIENDVDTYFKDVFAGPIF